MVSVRAENWNPAVSLRKTDLRVVHNLHRHEVRHLRESR